MTTYIAGGDSAGVFVDRNRSGNGGTEEEMATTFQGVQAVGRQLGLFTPACRS